MAILVVRARHWLLLVLGLLACAGFLLWVVRGELGVKRGPVWEKYQKIQLGMTEKEVRDILGPPHSVEGGGLMSHSCSAWSEGEQTIAVDFDMDGRATEKHFRPSRSAGWVRDRARKP